MNNYYSFDGPFGPDQIANLDEVPLFLDLTPDHTLENKGAKEVSIRVTAKYKVRATLVLCCLADGSKLPPMLIFKENSGNLPKKLQGAYDSRRVVIRANKKGWMTQELMEDWMKEVWIPNTDRNKSYLMIWDAFACHKNEKLINQLAETCDTTVEIIPGGCTSVLQPLDVGINKPLKTKIRSEFQNWSVAKLLHPTGKKLKF
jgi:hypothetical protein